MRALIIVVGLLSVLVAPGCASVQKSMAEGKARRAAHAEAVRKARAACYELEPALIYAEVYAVVRDGYTIERESERRGFMETGWSESGPDFAGAKRRTKVSAELVGDKCVRVVVNANAESMAKGATTWTSAAAPDTDSLVLKIDERLRQRLPAKPEAAAEPTPAPSK